MNKIINFCPTGTQTTAQNSLAPLTAEKIVDEVRRMYDLNYITLVHVHARDKDGNNSCKASDYEPIVNGIRKHCKDLAICVSMSGRYFKTVAERTEVLQLKPDMASLTMSSLNFPNGESVNSPQTILELIDAMRVNGVVPEIECFDSGMVNYALHLIQNNLLPKPYYFNIIFGNLFNAQSDLLTVGAIKAQILLAQPLATVCFGGIGRQQLYANILGLLEVDGIRIGLEDNTKLNGKAASNEQLLHRMMEIMKQMNLTVTPPHVFNVMGFNSKLPKPLQHI